MKLNVRENSLKFGSNILDIEVPDALRTKVPTGIDYFDCALGGKGFTPSQVVFFTGTPGAGKTTMMLATANALTKNGNQVVFNTAEESLYQVKLVAERLGLKAGFRVGQETHIPTLLAGCDEIRAQNPNKPFILIVDSLQCMDDGHYPDGQTNSRSPERALALITDWCKSKYTNSVVIGQVTKDGKQAGTNKLKHMVDAMLHLSIEEKDPDLKGCRVLQTVKNRFGGGDATFYMAMSAKGFKEVARLSAHQS